jgi:glutathione S-transferase
MSEAVDEEQAIAASLVHAAEHGTQMQIRLFDWAPSPFSLKVRAILEYKGISYARMSILQPGSWLELRRRGKIGKAPALEIEGRLFVDSTDIAYELERRFPSPPIIPAKPRERALCHALEEWSDESLYFVGLYYQWHDPEGRKMVPQVFGSSLYGRVMFAVVFCRRTPTSWAHSRTFAILRCLAS